MLDLDLNVCWGITQKIKKRKPPSTGHDTASVGTGSQSINSVATGLR